MRVRENWGVSDEGTVIVRRAPRSSKSCGFDLDEWSYDDRIRRRYLRELENPRHILKDDGIGERIGWKDEEWRSEGTSRFLGYPELPVSIVRILTGDVVKSKYSFEEKFGDEYLLSISQRLRFLNAFDSAVSLTSFLTYGKKTRLFTCSGIVIDAIADYIMIVTSACLVCHMDDDGNLKLAKDLKIKVRYGNDESYSGSLLSCCFNYNLAFIKVKEKCKIRPMRLVGRDCLYDDIEVFAIGKHYLSGDIMIASGRTTTKINPFDCAELMFSTCKITKCGIGGLLVDSNGELIGINFYDKNDTPYIPTCLILECWFHVQTRGKVMQPYFGWKLREIEFEHLHEIYAKHGITDAVVVDKVKRGSPAQLCGICDGDIIVEFGGKPATFLAECAVVFLDKELHGLKFEVKIVREEDFEPIRIYTNKTLDKRYHNVNRWPLPKFEWELIRAPTERWFRSKDNPSLRHDLYIVEL